MNMKYTIVRKFMIRFFDIFFQSGYYSLIAIFDTNSYWAKGIWRALYFLQTRACWAVR